MCGDPRTCFPGAEVANVATGHAGHLATHWRPGMSLHLAGSKSVNETTSDTSVRVQFLDSMSTHKTSEGQWPAYQRLACALISGEESDWLYFS